jgi:hypothetical protein
MGGLSERGKQRESERSIEYCMSSHLNLPLLENSYLYIHTLSKE